MIADIWEIKYVRTLGILDHCQEVLTLYDKIRVEKNLSGLNTKCLEDSVEKEMIDLFLILEKHFEHNVALKEERLRKFSQKTKENTILKTSEEWLTHFPGLTSMDPDGWDRTNYDYSFNFEKITLEEFKKRVLYSTIMSDSSIFNMGDFLNEKENS